MLKTVKERCTFDLQTQRFLVNRWDTEVGQKVQKNIIEGLKISIEVRAILDPYVLEHEKNIEPYGYPYYPHEAMDTNQFWVLNNDDLRGISIHDEEFTKSESFAKKSFSYGSFQNLKFVNVNFEMTELCHSRFEKCYMDNIILAYSIIYSSIFKNCSLINPCLVGCGIEDCDFRGTKFAGAYFQDASIENIIVNYQSKFDLKLRKRYSHNIMPKEQIADILKPIRIAYSNAELWNTSDEFLKQEKTNHRKYILWPNLVKEKNLSSFYEWFRSLISGLFSGYNTKPLRVLFAGLALGLIYSATYLAAGVPKPNNNFSLDVWQSVYFSFTTFATLGYGDLSYGPNQPILRILCTMEAILGAIFIALFVVVFARKVFR